MGELVHYKLQLNTATHEQGPFSISRHLLTSIGVPIIKIRRPNYRLNLWWESLYLAFIVKRGPVYIIRRVKDFTHNNTVKCRYNTTRVITILHMAPWWRHQMETFSALLALCAGNSPVTGEYPTQRPVTRSFYVFLDLRVDKRLSKQSWAWWFETQSSSLWRHCNDYDNSDRKWIRFQNDTRHPISCPHGRAMGCLLWGFWRKANAFWRHRTVWCKSLYM